VFLPLFRQKRHPQRGHHHTSDSKTVSRGGEVHGPSVW
jgi:hypothetical protein